jgi:Ras-like protein family protein 11A
MCSTLLHVDVSLTLIWQSGNELLSLDTIQWADGFLLVYSITDRQSFNYIKRVRQQLHEYRNGGSNTLSVGPSNNNSNSLSLRETGSASPSPIPMVLVANKGDMVHLRQISTEEGIISLTLIPPSPT